MTVEFFNRLRRGGGGTWYRRALSAGAAILASSTAALAYRPFVGTDAAVADVNETEIELQPYGTLRQDQQTNLVAPDVVYNYGFAKDWEFVFEGTRQAPLGTTDEPANIVGVGAFLKYVAREGVLQDKAGPSIAFEFGPLLPGLHADQGFGASLDTIVSQRWDWGTIHGNFATTLTRDQHADIFLGAIIEGPIQWKVRPVAEFFYEEEIGRMTTMSGLVGAIWQVNDKLSFDVGYRHAWVNSKPLNEVRAGLTFGFELAALDGRKSR
jgi:hypothetical protein